METNPFSTDRDDLHRYFEAGHTQSYRFRIQQLRNLKSAIQRFEPKIIEALHQDLGKSHFEGYASEVGFCYEEINHTVRHLRRWMKPRQVMSPLVLQPALTRIHPQPKGVVLIISPWNYPFQLLISPLIGALSAGNCALLKPSELSSATTEVLKEMIEDCFDANYVRVIEADGPQTSQLLELKFNHILFTGSERIGKIVMEKASQNLVPVTLELGGKSPCIVTSSAHIKSSARRIVWGKFFNAGQTCIAPDYLLVHESMRDNLLASMRQEIEMFFGTDPKKSPDYGRIIHERHFDRLVSMIDKEKVLAGGDSDRDTRYIAPTILGDVDLNHPSMQEEIFGPIFPVMTFQSMDQVFEVIRQRPDPLACYLFSNDRAEVDRVIHRLPFGGGCINNALLHCAHPGIPFGGIGSSGMGAYHGKDGFDTFSHHKSIVRTPAFEIPLKYPPYHGRLWLLKWMMR